MEIALVGNRPGWKSIVSPRCHHVHLDPLGGISGDMFLAALLNAWPEAAEPLEAAIRAVGLPADWRFEVAAAKDQVLTGTRVAFEPPAAGKSRPTGAYREIAAMIRASALEAGVIDRALDILTRLAMAEAEVHGIPVDDVHFHELADWDSIADVTGSAFMIDWLGAASWSTAPLPLGKGRITTAHGPLPVPAPATAKLLKGFEVVDDGIGGERITPTGAAILAHLSPASAAPSAKLRLLAEGTGFGSRTLPGLSNVLRVLCLGEGDADPTGERIQIIAFEVDDQTPEDLALALDRLRGYPGVLDVLQAPATGKKGRLMAQIQVLAQPRHTQAIIEGCFRETTTIGVRHRLEDRVVLPRHSVAVRSENGMVDVKMVDRPGVGRTAKADIDSLREGTDSHSERQSQRKRAETRALEGDDDDG